MTSRWFGDTWRRGPGGVRNIDFVLGSSLRVVALAFCAVLALAAPASGEPAVDGEFDVAGLDGNRKLVADPQGNVWVAVADGGRDVARITPAGEVTPFDLGVTNTSGVAIGPEGLVWMTHDAGVVKFDPVDPEGSAAPTAITVGGFHSLALGPDGNLWLATTDKLVRIPPADPNAKVEFNVAGLNPRDIDVSGSLFAIADAGEKIVTATTAGATTDHPVASASQGVAGGPGGLIAFSLPNDVQLGLLQPPAAPTTVPSPGGDPFGVTLGPDGAFWFAMATPREVARLTPDGQVTTVGAFSAGADPRQIAAGAGGTLWVTLPMADKVGRVSGVEPPPDAIPIAARPPDTRIVRGPKGRVRAKGKWRRVAFRFRAIPAKGARFQCALVKLPPRGRKPLLRPRFRACKSPRAYRLKPGRYRFRVRAVLHGVVDPTPAKRAFRIVRSGRAAN